MPKLKKDGTPSKQGENGGRPLKFMTAKELEELSIGYIEYLQKQDPTLEKPLGVEPSDLPTKSGLRIWLDISPSTYSDYKKRFPNALKRVENIIEDTWVQKLAGQNVTGSIFYLKNAYAELYRDRTETDITSGGKVIPILGGKTNVRRNPSPQKNTPTKETA